MFAVKTKIYGVLYKQSWSIAFDETSSYWLAAFHWSPRGSLVSIGQHFVTTRVVHLPKRTETSLITESDQSRANHQLLQLCTVRTAWSDSDYGYVIGEGFSSTVFIPDVIIVNLQWLEQLWNHENMFETGVFRANEC